MTNLRTLVESTLVPHSAFEKGRERLDQCFSYAATAAEPICIPVIGESRTGKSRLVEECGVNHPRVRMPDGLQIPVLHVSTPSKPTVKGLAELMLQRIGDPRYHYGTEVVKTARLRKLMQDTGTRMVVIDEFQHFYDKCSHKVMHYVADWLKTLVDACKIALVVAGLPSCRAVLEQNEQLAGRFLSPIVMPRFVWKIEDHREEFVGVLAAFQESLSRHFCLPSLDSDEMAFRFYCGTGGLIGYLTKCLRQAVWDAIDDNRDVISLEHLKIAHAQSVWNRNSLSDIPNPFSRDFAPSPSEDLLERIQRIGIPPAPVPIPRGRPRGKKSDLRGVLSAS